MAHSAHSDTLTFISPVPTLKGAWEWYVEHTPQITGFCVVMLAVWNLLSGMLNTGALASCAGAGF